MSKEWEDRYTDMCRQAADLSDRNRELTARMDAAEKLAELCRYWLANCQPLVQPDKSHPLPLPIIDAWLATPAQPAAGEEIDCVRCGNKHSGGC